MELWTPYIKGFETVGAIYFRGRSSVGRAPESHSGGRGFESHRLQKITMELKGKIAIITGAAKGIGYEIARLFAENDIKVMAVDIDSKSLEQLATKIDVETMIADVTDEESVKEVVNKTIDKFGSLHILVNNAGITSDALMIRMKTEQFERVIDVNLKGTFLMSRMAARHMMKNRYGKIVNISSVVGINGNAGQVNYSASKAGIIGMTRTMAKELGSRGIRVNAIAPGFIETDMTESLSESVKDFFLKQVLLNQKPGMPEDVARAVLFLASPQSDYITGTVLPVDGGMVIS